MELSSDLKRLILDAMLDAFNDVKDVKRIADLYLDGAARELGSGTIDDEILKLLDWATAHDKLREFLRGALNLNKDNRLLAAAAIEIEPVLAQSANQSVATLRTGLASLNRLVHTSNPALISAIQNAKQSLEAIQKRLRLVRVYKTVHDILHEIEKDCYEPVVLELRICSEDFYDNIEIHYDAYVTKVQLLEQSARDPVIITDELDWVARRMTPLTLDWKNAIDKRAMQEFAGIEKKLARVLATYPTIIDNFLFRTAADMLPEFYQIMAGIARHLPPDRETDDVKRFIIAVDKLHLLNSEFNWIIIAHHRLQEIENEVRRLTNSLPDDLDELIACWPEVQELAHIIADPTESWAARIIQRCEGVQRAIVSRREADITKQFGYFRQLTGDVFFAMDKRLRMRCDNLPDIASDLDRLLNSTGGQVHVGL